MKINLTLSFEGDAYISTLSDRNESVCCKPVSETEYDNVLLNFQSSNDWVVKKLKDSNQFKEMYDIFENTNPHHIAYNLGIEQSLKIIRCYMLKKEQDGGGYAEPINEILERVELLKYPIREALH